MPCARVQSRKRTSFTVSFSVLYSFVLVADSLLLIVELDVLPAIDCIRLVGELVGFLRRGGFLHCEGFVVEYCNKQWEKAFYLHRRIFLDGMKRIPYRRAYEGHGSPSASTCCAFIVS